MEATKKYLVSADYVTSEHGALGCRACHEGNNIDDKTKAHEGLIKRPSADNDGVCADCHKDVTEKYKTSLHNMTAGIKQGLAELAYPHTYGSNEELAEVYGADCSKCHATCGDCHVRRPNSIQGGLFDQHNFTANAPIEETCWGCHGARNAGEYIGNINGMASIPDLHYKNGMDCTDCHDIANFHGGGKVETAMYELDNLPQCIDCHEDVYSKDSPIAAHKAHDPELMSCQVCHSIPSNNCYSCHVKAEGGSEITSEIQFKIGMNPEPSEKYPYKYVVVRHIPTTSDMLAAKGENLLPNYDQVPNWKMSPSHNIQRRTPYNRDCSRCHGNEKIFLTEKDLRPDDSKANEKVVVKEIPPTF